MMTMVMKVGDDTSMFCFFFFFFLPDNKNVTIPQIYGPAETVSGILTNTNERHFNLYRFNSFDS